MAFDSLTDTKTKYLIVHDALGNVYFFGINQVWSRKRNASDISSAKSLPSDWKLELCIMYQTKLLINPKEALIDDLCRFINLFQLVFFLLKISFNLKKKHIQDNNGSKKMIVSYMDRIVRVYGWSSNASSSSTTSQSTIGNMSGGRDSKTPTSSAYNYSFQENGKLVLEHSWEMPDLVNSIHIFKDMEGIKHLIVTVPGYRGFQIIKLVKLGGSNASSASSLYDSISKLRKQQLSDCKPSIPIEFTKEEIMNFISFSQSTDVDKLSMPTHLATNVMFNKCDQYAYMITVNSDVFFFKYDSMPIKAPIWHRQINALVLKYFKLDIDVTFF
jgi:hypothetical protein